MTKQDIQFQIDQLRKDKMIYALESIATSAAAVLVMFGLIMVSHRNEYSGIVIIIAILYWAYVMMTNFFRLLRIRKLEKLLLGENHEKS